MPEPHPNDRNKIALKLYLFSTPKHIDLTISKLNTVEEVIRHALTVCLQSRAFKKEFFNPKKNDPRIIGNPDAYELRLLEDDCEAFYLPLSEISALSRGKCIGDFDVEALGFCRVQDIDLAPAFCEGKGFEEDEGEVKKTSMIKSREYC